MPEELVPLDEMMARLERALAASPADSTEIAWIEVRRERATGGAGQRTAGTARPAAAGKAGTGSAEGRPSPPGAPRSGGGGSPGSAGLARTLLIRVRQSGRTGLHRTGGGERSELENAVRDAMAQARLAPATPAEPLAGGGGADRRVEAAPAPAAPHGGASLGAGSAVEAMGGAGPEALHDPALAELDPAGARALLDRMAADGERLRLDWLDGRVAVANSNGLRRAVRVTAAGFKADCGAGCAAGAARRLEALDLAAVLDRARTRGSPAGAATEEAPAGAAAEAAAMVLSEQGVAALLDLLNRHALAATTLRDGSSCLCGRLGEALFAPCLNLRDDGTDPRALPFPFDLAGWPKRPVDLIVGGVFATPAVDARLGQAIGRQPTPHAMAPDESIAANLLLLPGAGGADPVAAFPETELRRSVEQGLWIGELAAVECYDPRRLRFRALARGVRRIVGGTLGPQLPDLLWEDGLPAVLARVQAVGDRPVAIPTGDMLFGAIAAPLLAIHGGGRLSVPATRQ
jgi:predicted Zn-dependent protease